MAQILHLGRKNRLKVMSEERNEEKLQEEQLNNENTEQTTAEEQAEEPQEKTIEEQLEDAKAEIEAMNDKYLRLYAEFENYRKRTVKEKTELILNGGEKAITSILPVLDDMERALKNMQNADDVSAVLEGVELINKKFIEILKKQGVEAIQTENADFNVDLHEAIAQLPAPCDELKGKVMDCTLTGYKLNDKVIRHAQVVVGL